MKVLNLSAYNWANGGPAHVIHDNTKMQISMGHSVDILSPYRDGDDFYPLPAGAKLIPIKVGFFSKLYPDFSFSIYKYIRDNLHQYDIVHIHGLWNFPGLIALLAANKSIVKVVTIHGTSTEAAIEKGKFKKMFFWWAIQKRALKKSDLIQIHNTNELNGLNKLFAGYKHNNIKMITNGVDFEQFRNLPVKGNFRKKIGISDDDKIILFFGRLSFIKGIDLLMPAFRTLLEYRQDVVLVFAGADYGMLSFINEYAADHNISDKVKICGMITGSEKYQVLVDSDVYVLPSYTESFSIAALEACAAGLPVVVSSEIGFSFEVEQSKIGLMIDFNADSITKKLNQIISDDELRVSSGINARHMVEAKYDLKFVTIKLINEMEFLVEKKRA